MSSNGPRGETGFFAFRNFQPQTVALRSSAMMWSGDLCFGPRTWLASSGRLSLRTRANLEL
eukprot:8332792-Alexandrium_andersonii.AAC.1